MGERPLGENVGSLLGSSLGTLEGASDGSFVTGIVGLRVFASFLVGFLVFVLGARKVGLDEGDVVGLDST